MKLKLKFIYSSKRMKDSISDDLKDYISKENKYYDFISLKEEPDFIFCHDFKIWKKLCPEILTSNKPILTNVIVFDNFKLNNKTSLRRLYLGTLSMKNTIKIPFIENRAEKLINEYNVEFSKNCIFNTSGPIVICPNRHTFGWYKYNHDTLSSINEIERNIKLIKANSELDIEIRMHPNAQQHTLDNLIKKYNIKINKDDLDTLSRRAYCIISDRSSIGPKMFLKGNVMFNFQKDYEHSIIGEVCLTDPTFLNPNNLKQDTIPNEKTRYNYLNYIATQAYTDDEINNGYFLENIHNLLYKEKDKFTKLKC